jgi:hypothetical protein
VGSFAIAEHTTGDAEAGEGRHDYPAVEIEQCLRYWDSKAICDVAVSELSQYREHSWGQTFSPRDACELSQVLACNISPAVLPLALLPCGCFGSISLCHSVFDHYRSAVR